MTEPQFEHPTIVSRAEWLAARKELLAKEKEFSRQRDALSAERRKMPWVRLETDYVFDTPDGPRSLSDLFGDKSQLVIYHFMLGPGWEQGCPSCSLIADHINGSVIHLAQRDTALAVVSRAPLAEIETFKQRMGWHFPWVSSHRNTFNHDHHVHFTDADRIDGKIEYNYGPSRYGGDELPGLSVFYRDARNALKVDGEVFHTYSTYARGLENLIGAYNYLDLVPKGRDEAGHGMGWVRHHDRY